jgi:hypothetical protein
MPGDRHRLFHRDGFSQIAGLVDIETVVRETESSSYVTTEHLERVMKKLLSK